MTSPTTAASGSYGIGLGTSSSVGSTHTKSASKTYVVASAGLTETVGLSKTSYKAGEVVYMAARVKKNGVPVKGATVNFTVLKPDKVNKVILNATTDSYGLARVSFKSGTSASSIGAYAMTATATSGTLAAKASFTFRVSN